MDVKPKRYSTHISSASKDAIPTAEFKRRLDVQKHYKDDLFPDVPCIYLYTLPASCYPRYRYFRELLHRFLPRFRRTIEHGQIPKFSKSNTYASICEDGEKFGKSVYVWLETENDSERNILGKAMVKSETTKKDSELLNIVRLKTFPPTEEKMKNMTYSTGLDLRKPLGSTLNSFFLDDFFQFGGFCYELFFQTLMQIIMEYDTQKPKDTLLNTSKEQIKPKRPSSVKKHPLDLTFDSDQMFRINLALTNKCWLHGSIGCFRCNLSNNTLWYSVTESEISLYTDDGAKLGENLFDVIQQILERNVVSIFKKILDFTRDILKEDHDPDNSDLTRVIKSVERLQFEVLGILRQSSFDFKDTLPRNPDISNAMREDIMKLPEAVGCGTVSGVFTIFFSGNRMWEKDLETILKKHNFNHQYRINTETKISKCSNLYHGSGKKIRAKGKTPQYGTLGCFVKLKQKNNAVTADELNDLYFITCGHCVNDSQNEIDIDAEGEYIPFGKTQYTLYDGNLKRDIAFVEVLPDRVKDCDTSIYLSCGFLLAKKWEFMEESAQDGLPVYKVGATSNMTQGVVVSSNDLSFVCEEGQQTGSFEGLVFIDAVETLENQVPFFSESGDSGSIVCSDDIDSSDRVKVVSLLSGTIETKTRSDGKEAQEEQREVTCSFHLQRAIRDAEEEFGFTAEPAIDQGDEEEGATGGIGPLSDEIFIRHSILLLMN